MGISARELAAVPGKRGRRDPVAILAAQDVARLADLVPVRHERMSATPFTFYRGAAAVMAADLASTPNSGIITQLCGDAHLSNFGLFLSPERQMVFDLNDFDETHPGPFEWDVKRLAASMVVAAQGNGADNESARRMARRAARAYRRTMITSAAKSALECWYDHIDTDEVLAEVGGRLDTAASERIRKLLEKSRHRNSDQALSKLCVIDRTGVHIKSDPPLLIPGTQVFPNAGPEELQAQFQKRFAAYRKTLSPYLRTLIDQYELIEVARKVVGVGSVGTRCWIALFAGRDNMDPLFLQMKEAVESVLAPYVDSPEWANQGHRVVHGQQLMQASSDVLLGWMRAPAFTSDMDGTALTLAGKTDFYIRQLRDGKGSAVIEGMPDDQLARYGELCGKVLAQAHARTDARVPIADCVDRLGKKFDRAIADWSLDYARINLKDHARLVGAIAAGSLSSAPLES
ncbi:hypothetical protein GOHSU_31_00260 [Gordonia hirsuta DSM 44140 = NBRC 16056]|uniref:DUF2252 domain-containing protein n=1 Tax=Gordonia hirsuta DSM 44140 = NBRC 16056 TaxID=1121927 RepID=L7LAJ7_9ACTN|nr:DUF2252 domain-containing protein [Gordonia hirsuta]GAC58165.1 hypothetical protein GOHSU_31_00260 [Gordonia hirsuta DSM 44140 = NBRC 16056]